MTQQRALAKPSLSDAVFNAMKRAGSGAPGYRENDGTTYRVLEFSGNADVPKHLRDKFVGAIAEWANDAEEATDLTLYKSLDLFDSHRANIHNVAEQL
ncbi:MAG: hypothetical protein ACYS7Y_30125 [Planctomycetota bacterium]|jgi:hypothetical protein